MNDLIEALQIFLKYGNPEYPTHCSHDELSIMEITKDQVSEDDLVRLDELGFFWSDDEEEGCFKSFRFGSA